MVEDEIVRIRYLLCSLGFRVTGNLPDLTLSGLREGLVAPMLVAQDLELIYYLRIQWSSNKVRSRRICS